MLGWRGRLKKRHWSAAFYAWTLSPKYTNNQCATFNINKITLISAHCENESDREDV